MLFGEGPHIKNIAADLNKLFRQGSLLNQSVQNVEGDSTADQGTSDLLAARDPVIQEISVGMSGEQAARYTVSGTPPLSLPNSLGKPLNAWEVDVLPYQAGTGDPSPDNVRPIHGTDKLTITTAGKNLFDKTDSIINGYVDGQNGLLRIGQYYSERSYVSGLLPAGTYTISKVSSSRFRVGAYATIPSAGAMDCIQFATASPQTVTSFTITLIQNSYLVIFAYNGSAETVTPEEIADSMQIEVGSSSTPYTPYLAPSQTVLTLPQTVYTGTIGSEGGESRFGEFIFDGSEEWRKSEQYNYFETVSQLPNALHANTYSANQMNSKYAYGDITNTNTVLGSCMIWGRIRVRLADMSISLDDWYDLLEAVPMQVVYKLATPTTFAVPSVTIPTPTGTATTWATAEDGTVESMEVTYVGKA